MGLPQGYQQVEYIQANWRNGAYIAQTNVSTHVSVGTASKSRAILDAYFFDSSNRAEYMGANGNNTISTSPTGVRLNVTDYYLPYNTRKAFETRTNIEEYRSAIVDGITYVGTASPSQGQVFILFGLSIYHVPMRIYSFKFYVGDTLRCDYIPCIRESDSVVGFYDNVSQSFITDEGGFLIAGPAVVEMNTYAIPLLLRRRAMMA